MIQGFAITATVVFLLVSGCAMWFSFASEKDSRSGGDFGSVLGAVVSAIAFVVSIVCGIGGLVGLAALVIGNR